MDEKKYQVFVSSTYEDLISARKKIIETVLSLYHFPVGMEMFSADDSEQWEIIRETIDASDYYVIIIGHKYGSISNSGISYTEMEYNYAKSLNIPILAFIRNRDAFTKPNERELEQSKIEKLENFIENAKANKMCDFWDSIDELAMKVAVALPKVMRRTPRIGWVRGDQATSTEVSNELAELSTENRKLREKLREYESQLQNDIPVLFLSMINEDLTLNLSRLNETQQYIPLIKRDDIPSELNQYISDDDIIKYNKKIPSKEEVDKHNQEVFLYENYINNSITFTPIIENRGKKVATDIYVEIEFPEFLTFINDDDDDFFTKRPELNIPKTPMEIARNKIKAKEAIDIIRQSLSVSGGGGMAGLGYLNDRDSLLKSINTNINYPVLNRTQWIDFDGCKITLRAKKIIQSLSLEFESITIIPKCEGEGVINFKIICEELKEPIIYSYQVSVK